MKLTSAHTLLDLKATSFKALIFMRAMDSSTCRFIWCNHKQNFASCKFCRYGFWKMKICVSLMFDLMPFRFFATKTRKWRSCRTSVWRPGASFVEKTTLNSSWKTCPTFWRLVLIRWLLAWAIYIANGLISAISITVLWRYTAEIWPIYLHICNISAYWRLIGKIIWAILIAKPTSR